MTKEDIQRIINPETNRLQLSKLTVSLEEAYCIYNSITSKPLCKCNKPLPFLNFKMGYRKSCGNPKCKNKKPKTTPKKLTDEVFNEIFTGKGFNYKLGQKYCISQQDCYDFKYPNSSHCDVCGAEKTFIDFKLGYRKDCNCKKEIKLTKELIIDKAFTSEGNINPAFTKTHNTNIKEIYSVYHNIEFPKCSCGKDCQVITFKGGPLNHCGNVNCKNNAKHKLEPI